MGYEDQLFEAVNWEGEMVQDLEFLDCRFKDCSFTELNILKGAKLSLPEAIGLLTSMGIVIDQ